MEFFVNGKSVKFTKEKVNRDALEQVIHPMAVVDLCLKQNGKEIFGGNYQLDGQNNPIKFDDTALIFDTCIRKMVKGEVATIEIDSETFSVEIRQVVSCLPLWEIDTDTRLDHAEKLRLLGNDFFKVRVHRSSRKSDPSSWNPF